MHVLDHQPIIIDDRGTSGRIETLKTSWDVWRRVTYLIEPVLLAPFQPRKLPSTLEMGNGKWEMGNGKWEMGNSPSDCRMPKCELKPWVTDLRKLLFFFFFFLKIINNKLKTSISTIKYVLCSFSFLSKIKQLFVNFRLLY